MRVKQTANDKWPVCTHVTQTRYSPNQCGDVVVYGVLYCVIWMSLHWREATGQGDTFAETITNCLLYLMRFEDKIKPKA